MHALAAEFRWGVVKKIHRILAEACARTLESILRDRAVADRAVARTLGANQKWGARDRAFVAETVYDVVRWWRRLAVLAGADDPWALAGMQWTLKEFPRPEWAMWPEISRDLLDRRQQALAGAPRAVRESVSDELDALGAGQLGERWDVELAALNRPAAVFIRINPRRSSMKEVAAELTEAGLTFTEVPGLPFALRMDDGRTVPARLKDTGRFEIQDAGSQQVAPFLQAEPGHTVVDACAGAGGKTLHLGALMEGRGVIHALDSVEARLEALRLRAGRAGVKVKAVAVSPAILTKLDRAADRVLVDAPCSGSGTLRRQADLKYRITADSLRSIMETQREVLLQYAALVKPGGKLVYATCSVLPAENEEQAAWFSARAGDFSLEEEKRISPAETGWDGFYMARWVRES